MKPLKLKLTNMDSVIEYSITHKDVIYNQTFKMLRHAWNKSKSFSSVSLLVIDLEDDEDLDEAILTVEDDEWIKALEMSLEFFENKEEYEMCSKVNKLLQTIKKELK